MASVCSPGPRALESDCSLIDKTDQVTLWQVSRELGDLAQIEEHFKERGFIDHVIPLLGP